MKDPAVVLRKRLQRCLLEEPRSVNEMAEAIGLSYITFNKFINGRSKQPTFQTRTMLEKYIREFEMEVFGSIQREGTDVCD